MIYSIDFETRSKANLPDVGLDIYANDPTTEVLCIAFGTQPDNVEVQTPIVIDQLPTQLNILLGHVANGGKIQAWNAMFELSLIHISEPTRPY